MTTTLAACYIQFHECRVASAAPRYNGFGTYRSRGHRVPSEGPDHLDGSPPPLCQAPLGIRPFGRARWLTASRVYLLNESGTSQIF